MIPIIAAVLVVAFLLSRGWRGIFPDEQHHWQAGHASPPAAESGEWPT